MLFTFAVTHCTSFCVTVLCPVCSGGSWHVCTNTNYFVLWVTSVTMPSSVWWHGKVRGPNV